MRAAKSPQAFAMLLQKCGYSTNALYSRDLMELMRDYDLYQYDQPLPPADEKEKAA